MKKIIVNEIIEKLVSPPKLVAISRIVSNGVLYIGYDKYGQRYFINSIEELNYYRSAYYNRNLVPKNYDSTNL